MKTSRWCPQQSFSFWALPYLMGKGMSTRELTEFHTLMHEHLPVSTSEHAFRTPTPSTERLEKFVHGLQLSTPRFVRRSLETPV